MTELSPEAKALLELAREDDGPTPEDRVRVRRTLASMLAMGAATSATSLTAKSALGATGGAAKSGIAMWLAIGAVAGLAGSAAVVVGMPALSARHGTQSVASAPASPGPGAGEPAALPPEASGVATPPVHTPSDTKPAPIAAAEEPARPGGAAPQSTTRIAVRAPGLDASRVGPRSAPARDREEDTLAALDRAPRETTTGSGTVRSFAPVPAPSIGAETSLLGRARAALGRGDAASALALLDEHERRFPDGALVEERLATRVLALCGIGQKAQAARLARRFLESFPASPLRGRVLDSCAFER